MTRDTQRVVVKAIDQALAGWVAYQVRAVFAGLEMETFVTELNRAVGMHEELISQFGPNQEIEDAVQGRDCCVRYRSR